MKLRGCLLGSIVFALALMNAALADMSIGRITHYYGDVKVVTPLGTTVEAKKLLELKPGTTVKTGDISSATLTFEDGHSITLQSNTSFVIEAYRFDRLYMQNSSIVISLLKGGIRSITGLIGEMNRSAFKLNTPVATIGIRGTDFHVALHTDAGAKPGRLYSLVRSGAISIENQAGGAIVAGGQAAVVPSLSEPPRLIAPSTLPKRLFDDMGRMPSSSRSAKLDRTHRLDKVSKTASLERPGRPDRSDKPDRPERPDRREGRPERPEIPALGLLRRGAS